MNQGVYVHIPFCKQICHYCDFNKVLIKDQPVDDYVNALQTEGRLRLKGKNFHAHTVYVGGGTPTSLSAIQLDQLFENLRRSGIHWTSESEVTVEVNPDGVLDDQLAVLKRAGVNRLSIGVQTFDPQLLEKIGRTHLAGDVEQLLTRARDFGFQNVSIDLMYALPGQTYGQWMQTVEEAIRLDPDHISAYGLKIEPKTQFHNWQRSGKLSAMNEDDEADMYETLLERLKAAGYEQYEISNFAKPGQESRHNLLYWRNEPYLALGAGAHGYRDGTRYSNIGPIPHYLKSMKESELPTRTQESLTVKEQMEEEMFLGLRLREGVSRARFYQKYNVHLTQVYDKVLPELERDGLIEWKQDCVRLTEHGQLLGNEVFARFLLPKDQELSR